jgi:hypothetical protein
MNEEPRKGGIFTLAAMGASVVLFVLILVTGTIMGLSASEKSTLAGARKGLGAMNRRTVPNPKTVAAWEGYRGELEKGGAALDAYLHDRDNHFDAFFEEYPAKTRNFERFKGIYIKKLGELYEKARPILARDSSGMPLARDAVFSFEEWAGITPTPEEALPAQKKFWIQQDVVDVLLAMTAQADKKAQKPELLNIECGETVEKGFYDLFPATVTLRLLHADVGEFVNQVLRSEARRLLVRLTGMAVEKAQNLQEEYVQKVKDGEEKGFDAQAFIGGLRRPLKVVLSFEVIDLK